MTDDAATRKARELLDDCERRMSSLTFGQRGVLQHALVRALRDAEARCEAETARADSMTEKALRYDRQVGALAARLARVEAALRRAIQDDIEADILVCGHQRRHLSLSRAGCCMCVLCVALAALTDAPPDATTGAK